MLREDHITSAISNRVQSGVIRDVGVILLEFFESNSFRLDIVPDCNRPDCHIRCLRYDGVCVDRGRSLPNLLQRHRHSPSGYIFRCRYQHLNQIRGFRIEIQCVHWSYLSPRLLALLERCFAGVEFSTTVRCFLQAAIRGNILLDVRSSFLEWHLDGATVNNGSEHRLPIAPDNIVRQRIGPSVVDLRYLIGDLNRFVHGLPFGSPMLLPLLLARSAALSAGLSTGGLIHLLMQESCAWIRALKKLLVLSGSLFDDSCVDVREHLVA